MKIVEYQIIRDDNGHPQLAKSHEYNWNGKDFNTYGNIVKMMNVCFRMNKLNEEYAYVLAFDVGLKLLGVYEVGHGSTKTIQINNKEIYTFLLLVGAEQFILIHNHPSGTTEISKQDDMFTSYVNAFSAILNIPMTESMIIAGDSYSLIQEKHMMEFKNVFK